MNKLYEYYSPARANIVVENANNGKDLYMSGIFVQADMRNQNQRVYPLNEISKAVKSVKARIQEGITVWGEAEHPPELTINLDRISHMITDMWMDGNNGHGKLKILDTPTGIIVKTLLVSGGNLGVSSRGSGNVDNNGYVSDFEMVTVDIVAQPSAPDAYPRAIYESLFNMKGGSAIMEMAKGASYGDSRAKHHLSKEIISFVHELRKK